MKLLFDLNISFRIIPKLVDIFPLAQQVRFLDLENESDATIWNYAKNNAYTIVTFDADFYDMLLVKGTPPKIIWLKFGNASTDYIVQRFRKQENEFKLFLNDLNYEESSCLELND